MAKNNSTIAIDEQTKKKLLNLCDSLEMTQKDFLASAVDYFQRTGIDPRTDEMAKSNQEIADQLKIISAQMVWRLKATISKLEIDMQEYFS